jgi:hypothetical protein
MTEFFAMGQNEGFAAQGRDLPLFRASFSVGAAGAGVAPVLVPPGPNNTALGAMGTGASGAPGFGQLGVLVPVSNPSNPPTIAKMVAQFLGSSAPADAAQSLSFLLYVQRNALSNASAVANQGAIPVYGGAPLAPVQVMPPGLGVPFATPVASAAALPGGAPTQVSADFSMTPWVTAPGDVYYVLIIFSVPLVGTINNAMVTLG